MCYRIYNIVEYRKTKWRLFRIIHKKTLLPEKIITRNYNLVSVYNVLVQILWKPIIGNLLQMFLSEQVVESDLEEVKESE